MSSRMKLWLLPTLAYAIFVFWYTDFGGPLSDKEVDEFVEIMTSNGSAPERVELHSDKPEATPHITGDKTNLHGRDKARTVRCCCASGPQGKTPVPRACLCCLGQRRPVLVPMESGREKKYSHHAAILAAQRPHGHRRQNDGPMG